MGIVLKQSLKNTLVTYIGFGIGAINTLFLYTRFLTDEYYGLVGVLLSAAAVLMPLLAFGVPNTMVKFYSSYKETKELDSFLTLMLLLPLALIIPIAAISFFSYDIIGDLLSKENPIVEGYVYHIFLIGMAMAYFEVFYAWAKVQMKSVFGNFMKEVFIRVCIMVLLFLVYFNTISVETFLKALVVVYMVRTILMKLYAHYLRKTKINFNFPNNTKQIISYSTLIILGGSAAVILLEVDKVMINQYIKIENVAYYSVAIFIATVIAVPSRAMHQITYPLTGELMNRKNIKELKVLYQKSSLTLFMIAGPIYLLIILNLNDLYDLLPEDYSNGFIVVFLIGLAKIYDALLGNNNAILYNSEYYKTVMLMGVFLAICTILFNMWLIPNYGLIGAAYATFLALSIYNTIKIFFVKIKFNMQPFTIEITKVLLLLLILGGTFYFLQLPFHPILNIVVKSVSLMILYISIIYKFKISEDVYGILSKYIKRS